MKRILLFVTILSLYSYSSAQESNWEVYLTGFKVKSIEFENDDIWGATDHFLFRFNRVDLSTTYYPFPDGAVRDMSSIIKIDKDGVKWIGLSEYLPSGNSIYESYQSSIYSFDGNQWKKIKSIGFGQITSLAIDRSNNKWIRTVGNNLYKKEQDSFVQYTTENSGLVYGNVRQVASDKDGNIWVIDMGNYGLIGGDMELMKNDGDQWISYFSGAGVYGTFMLFDHQGNPWIQSFQRIQKLDTASTSNTWSEPIVLESFMPSFPESPRIFGPYPELQAFEGEDKLWFNHRDNGIASYKDSVWSFYTTSNSELPSDSVYTIAVDSNGTKWIGTAKGLAAFNENGFECTVGLHSQVMDEVEIFPNPAHEFITLKMPKDSQSSTVDILSIQGKIIHSFSMLNDQTRLDVSHLPAGVYLVRVKSQQNYIQKKFIKQ
ncbi:MAG: T9SS type A sorting domain-containing protein [Bacteroidales bacterium]